MAAASDANAAQQEYWNTVAGPRWVGLEGFVERRVRGVNDLLLRHSAVKPGERVLEIGCGTGAFTLPLAEAVGERGEVVGADISDAMLAGAQKRLAESGRRNVSLMQADAQTHGFEPGRFDLIASRFGVMFFSDPGAAFANLRAAARPGGRLCFACWGPLDANEHWLIPYRVALRHLGPPEPKPARAPGPMAFSDPDYVRGFLGTAGFEAIGIHRETPGIFASAPKEEAEHACIMGPSGRLIDEKKPDAATLAMIRARDRGGFCRPCQERDGAAIDGVPGDRAPPAVTAPIPHRRSRFSLLVSCTPRSSHRSATKACKLRRAGIGRMRRGAGAPGARPRRPGPRARRSGPGGSRSRHEAGRGARHAPERCSRSGR